MLLTLDRLPGRIHAALAGAVAGEERAGSPTGAGQLLDAAESAARAGAFDPDDLRHRGLDMVPGSGPAGLLLRALPFALLTPLDRPLLRRNAHRAAALAGADGGTAMAAVAAAVLASDVMRFDMGVCIARLHQTLLEEAPMALLERLRPLGAGEPAVPDSDPGAALQLAITALDSGGGMTEVLDEVAARAEEPLAALSLAGALAGARDGVDALDAAWLGTLPAAARTADIAEALAARAMALLPEGA